MLFLIAETGYYFKHLERWLKLFDRRQFLVLQADMVYEGSPAALVKDTLTRLGKFLELDGPEWTGMISKGLPKRNSKGKSSRSFKLAAMDASLCRQMKAYYEGKNIQLYELLKRTHSAAPPEQPAFPEFKNLFVKPQFKFYGDFIFCFKIAFNAS